MTAIITFSQSKTHGKKEYAFKIAQNERRRAARRKTIAGFPSDIRFSTKKELAAYTGGAKIQCLICGRLFRALGFHLTVHDITEQQYRERFNIPEYWPLVCEATSQLMSDSLKKRICDQGKEERAAHMEHLAALRLTARKAPRRPISFLHSEAAVSNLKNAGLLRKKTYPVVTCGWCGEKFQSVRDGSKYCSQKCYGKNIKFPSTCRRGHAFSAENEYWSRGRRFCRKCRNEASVRSREKNRDATNDVIMTPQAHRKGWR